MMRPTRYHLIILPALLVMAAGLASAQTDTLRRAAPADTSTFRRSDTGSVEPAHMTKSPLTATLLSIIPGGGQIYDHNYFRAALFAGACGWFIGRAIYFHTLFVQKADQVSALSPSDSRVPLLKAQRELYRDDRDNNFAFYLGCHILCMIDAYVGAHLFDFDVGEDISSKIYLDPFSRQVTFSARW
jgi:hypothetical protein